MTSVWIMAAHAPKVVCLGLSKTTAVLSIGRLGVVTGADYYLANVANSVDDYYLGRGRSPGPVDRCHIGCPRPDRRRGFRSAAEPARGPGMWR